MKKHLLLIVCIVLIAFSLVMAIMVSACSRRDTPHSKVKTKDTNYSATYDEISEFNSSEFTETNNQNNFEIKTTIENEKSEITVNSTTPTSTSKTELNSNNNVTPTQRTTYNTNINPNVNAISNSVKLKTPKVTSPNNNTSADNSNQNPSNDALGSANGSTNPTANNSSQADKIWVVDTPAYDEVVNVFENKERAFCDDCGEDITDNIAEHIEKEIKENNGKGTYAMKTVNVQTSTTTIHHDEVGHYENRSN